MTQNASHRVGAVTIIVYQPDESVETINSILHEYSQLIVGRMGIPYRERGLFVISLIVDGSTDDIGAMTGKLGQVPSVTVKSAYAKLSSD